MGLEVDEAVSEEEEVDVGLEDDGAEEEEEEEEEGGGVEDSASANKTDLSCDCKSRCSCSLWFPSVVPSCLRFCKLNMFLRISNLLASSSNLFFLNKTLQCAKQSINCQYDTSSLILDNICTL